MTNAESNWGRIRRTDWLSVYLFELYWLAKETDDLCEELFDSALPSVPGKDYLQVNPKLHQSIYRILNNAARIGGMIKERARNTRNQSAGQYALQQQRVEWLQQVLEGIELSETLNSKVRHSLEHFDELIDETALKSSRGDFPEPTMFPLDWIIQRRDTLQLLMTGKSAGGYVYPLRIYIAELKTFVNCGREIDIGKVAEECRKIHERASQLDPDLSKIAEGDGSRVALMLQFSAEDYRKSEE